MPIASFVDPAAMLDSLDRRVYTLEQLLSSVDGPWSNTDFSSINIVPTDPLAQPLHVGLESDPATGLALTWSSFFDNIYVDVSWVAPATGTAQTYTVEWAKKIAGVYQLVNAQGGIVGDTLRVERLDPNTTYGFRVYGVNPIGVSSDPMPATGFLDVAVGQDATAPAAPTGVSVAQAIRGLMVRWNQNTEFDVANGHGMYKVELSSNAGFTAIVKSDITSATVWTTSDLTPGVQYWARVYAIDQGGNMSGPSAVATDSTEYVITNYVADFAVTNVKIGAAAVDDAKILSLSAGKVTFGVMSGDRIDVNTLNVNRLLTSSLTTQSITLAGGSLIAGNPGSGSGVVFNSQGIRAYNAGSLTMTIDVSGTISLAGNITSTATITGGTLTGATINGGTIIGGVFKTSATGVRTEINAAPASGTTGIDFYANNGETKPGGVRLYGGDLVIEGNYFSGSGHFIGSIRFFSNNTTGVNGSAIVIDGGVQFTNNVLVSGTLDVSSVLALNDQQLRFRTNSDANHRINYSAAEGTPSNGTQTVNGPVMYGAEATGMGGSSAWGMLFRAYASAGTIRLDSYAAHHFQNGVYVDGGPKGFLIDHPVKGEDFHLLFSSVESPHADLIYRGEAKMDKNGEVDVDIDAFYNLTPGTFQSLHRPDTRQFFLHNQDGEKNPKGKLSAGVLHITCEPGVVVGWMVIGERTDSAMRGNAECDNMGRIKNERKRTDFEKETKIRKLGPRVPGWKQPILARSSN